jgi:hypothetical protein
VALNKDMVGWYPTNQSAANFDPITELHHVVKFYAWKGTPPDQANYQVDYSEEVEEPDDEVD